MSNKAYLAWTTKVYPHPNADKLELAEVLGYQVIVGKGEVTEDTFGILFLPDSVLTDKAIEIFGEQPYLSKNRVKALTLRGEKSEALFLPLEHAKHQAGGNAGRKELLSLWMRNQDSSTLIAHSWNLNGWSGGGSSINLVEVCPYEDWLPDDLVEIECAEG